MNEHRIACQFCGKAFATNCIRRRHEEIHKHKQDKRHFDCNKCSRKSVNARTFGHILINFFKT